MKRAAGRAWLNPLGDVDTGWVGWNIKVGSYASNKNHLEGEILVHDCSRAVNLSLWCDNKGDVKKRIKKVDSFIKELEKCKAALEEIGEEL